MLYVSHVTPALVCYGVPDCGNGMDELSCGRGKSRDMPIEHSGISVVNSEKYIFRVRLERTPLGRLVSPLVSTVCECSSWYFIIFFATVAVHQFFSI